MSESSVLDCVPSAERAEYDALLSSGLFSGETNSSRFLRFVCNRYFAGDQHVSETDIAIEALGRRADFDPAHDSIVRVEAHRVRKRLKEYYNTEGSQHPYRLVLPQGSYLPVFVPAEPVKAPLLAAGTTADFVRSPETPPARVRERIRSRHLVLPLLLLGACLGLLGIALYLHQRTNHLFSAAVPAISVGTAAISSPDVMIMAGSAAPSYTDQLGHVWSADRFYEGGQSWPIRYRRILRTDDPQLFLSARQGNDFGYDIPLGPGLYELRLYFAETFYGDGNSEGGGESSRMFDVTANGSPLLTNFDPLSDAGGSNTADVRVFPALSPAQDGKLHLRFKNHFQLKGVAFVNAIQITRLESRQTRPIRWVASGSAVEDAAGRLWTPDQFVQGGRRRELGDPVSGTSDPELYKSERYGNFSYAIPVAEGSTYTLTLMFSEHWFGVPNSGGDEGPSPRIFDVYCNGTYLLKDFEIMKEAGGSLKAVTRTFHGLRPNHQGKLLISFVPNRDYASLTALEVMPENPK